MLPEVIVDIGAALICFMSTCYPALIGKDTPTGEYELVQYTTDAYGYGGNILVFKDADDGVFAVHRVLNLPGQRRLERLRSNSPEDRKNVTAGCVNVDFFVYDLLLDCCQGSKIIIQ